MRSKKENSANYTDQRWYSGLGMLALAIPQLLALAWIIGSTQPAHAATPASAPQERMGAPMEVDAGKVYGKIQFVSSFPDYKVQVVDSFPDLKVEKVTSFPDSPGKWQVVDSFPDYKIQIVDSFPDFKIQYVTSFPGTP